MLILAPGLPFEPKQHSCRSFMFPSEKKIIKDSRFLSLSFWSKNLVSHEVMMVCPTIRETKQNCFPSVPNMKFVFGLNAVSAYLMLPLR